MSPDNLFLISCIIAAVGWVILLVFSPSWPGYDKFVVGVVIVLLALLYSSLNLANFSFSDAKKFASLDGVGSLYQNKFLLLAGWVHILAFDLMAAVWIKKNAVQHGIKHSWIILSLFFTCMLGPLGFLIYLLTRFIKTKSWFAANF